MKDVSHVLGSHEGEKGSNVLILRLVLHTHNTPNIKHHSDTTNLRPLAVPNRISHNEKLNKKSCKSLRIEQRSICYGIG